MRIEVIDTPKGLAAVEAEWERVFAADPEARHFLSHRWIRRYFARRRRWFVLALRPVEGGPLATFFPLRFQTRQEPASGEFIDEIIMGGSYLADYNGFIVLPAFTATAARGFAGWLARQNWKQVRFDYVDASQPRIATLLKAMEGPGTKFRRITPHNEQGVDTTICPHITLPDSFETYLEEKVSSQTRQKMRRFLRKLDGGEFRITHATQATLGRDLDILFDFWRRRWAPVKGDDKTERLIVSTREMLEDCFADNDLEVPVLWCGERPLGALANILDRRSGSVLFFVTGRDEAWKLPSPGLMLHADAIRRAIAEGFRSYDFLRGNEPYKYVFGADERRLACIAARRDPDVPAGTVLNAWSVRPVYEKALAFHHQGRRDEAEIAFTQILEAAPRHGGAAFGLAGIHFEKGEFRKAETAYRALRKTMDDPMPVLMRLGDLLLATRRFSEAAECFADACRLTPGLTEARFKQGVAWLAAGRKQKAVAALSIAADIRSGPAANAHYAEKAREALARLIFVKAMPPAPLFIPGLLKPQERDMPWLH